MTYKEMCLEICKGEGVEYDDAISRSRKGEIVQARQLCMYFGNIFMKGRGVSYADLGKPFNRDHATVLHAIKTVRNRMTYNRLFRARVMHYEIKFENKKTETGIISIKEELDRNVVAHRLIMHLSEMRIIAEAYCLLSGHKLTPIKDDKDQN